MSASRGERDLFKSVPDVLQKRKKVRMLNAFRADELVLLVHKDDLLRRVWRVLG